MKLIVLKNSQAIAETATQILIEDLRQWIPQNENDCFLLGLPTGSSPIAMYQLWQKYSQEGRLDFRKIITFNMDEYVGFGGDHPSSYANFMQNHLFKGLLFPPKEIHLLDGRAIDLEAECQHYEQKIKERGGIDLFFGGVGTQGHLAFNEAYSSFSSRTRPVLLSSQTRQDNAVWFKQIYEDVPTHALSVGLGTLSEAKKLVILASGEKKAAAVAAGIEGPITHRCPLSLIQWHKDSLVLCDEEAASQLSAQARELLNVDGH